MYAKMITDGYVIAAGTGIAGKEITESEYNQILAAIQHAPEPPRGYDYRLRDADLEWELVELPPIPEPEPTAEELLDIILGGAT